MLYKNFYSELGKLLYAVAKADGKITEKEARTIHKTVAEELVPAETATDEFGTDAAHFTEIEFEILQETFASPEEAFNSFINYIFILLEIYQFLLFSLSLLIRKLQYFSSFQSRSKSLSTTLPYSF